MTNLALNAAAPQLKPSLDRAIDRSQDHFLSQQFADGYWWYTLEANESISAEYIFLTEFLGNPNAELNQALCRHILQKQRDDGSWALYFDGPGDLGTSIECYWALKMCGYDLQDPAMLRAKEFILKSGGPTKARVFTKIHLAMFGLAPWESVPVMPISLILMPSWLPFNIYEFSSWARACIVPLLVILNQKPVHSLKMDLEELYPEAPDLRQWDILATPASLYSFENLFLLADKALKTAEKWSLPSPLQKQSLDQCVKYIREHVEKTEDIFPAMAYSAMALKTLGSPLKDPIIQRALQGLQNFQQVVDEKLSPVPIPLNKKASLSLTMAHQQCCVSPVWDTPWMAISLLDSGMETENASLKKAQDWLLSKQIVKTKGDWAVKNKSGKPGGWSFEFYNDYFPDVDDTIEVLTFFYKMGLSTPQLKQSFNLGLQWLLSMRSKNGGWAAFDVDNTQEWVNHIPFSDHGACLDPPTPDITARMIEFLALIGWEADEPVLKKAVQFLLARQLPCGAWEGRWGVNYLYGTWCVLQGLSALGFHYENHYPARKAVRWLLEQQNRDGGWGESCASDAQKRFVPLSESVPSQTAWAVMGLVAAGLEKHEAVQRGIDFLIRKQNALGAWDEEHYTGTGFPGHFYIRYHGYRHYFPLMALGKYRQATLGEF